MDAKHPESEAPLPRSGRTPSTEPAGPPDGCIDEPPESRETIPPPPGDETLTLKDPEHLKLFRMLERRIEALIVDLKRSVHAENERFQERIADRVQENGRNLARHLEPLVLRAQQDSTILRRMDAIEAEQAALRARLDSLRPGRPSQPEPEGESGDC